MSRYIILVLMVCMHLCAPLLAQDDQQNSSGSSNGLPPARATTISEQDWERATGHLDFTEKEKKEHQPEWQWKAPEFSEGSKFSFLIQVLIIALVLGGLLFAIFNTLNRPQNQKVKGNYDIDIQNIEENLHETDLMRYLQEAIDQGDYALAIRLYFLQILKNLAQNNEIAWSKDKTNRTYLRELTQHPQYIEIVDAMRTYEEVWFGKSHLLEPRFRVLEPNFKNLLTATQQPIT